MAETRFVASPRARPRRACGFVAYPTKSTCLRPASTDGCTARGGRPALMIWAPSNAEIGLPCHGKQGLLWAERGCLQRWHKTLTRGLS